MCLTYIFFSFTLVESIPENLTYDKSSVKFPSTFDTWEFLLSEAKEEIDMGEFYFALRNEDVTPIHMNSSWQGEKIFKDLVHAGNKTIYFIKWFYTYDILMLRKIQKH